VTHVLLHEGHLWGREKISNPVSAVTGVENGIRLSLAGVVASPPLGQKAGGGFLRLMHVTEGRAPPVGQSLMIAGVEAQILET
jgi:hypothetical protein